MFFANMADEIKTEKMKSFMKHFNTISYKDANEISKRRYSCMAEKQHEMKISLSPKYLGNIRLGLKETLQKDLFSYNEELRGVPIAFDKVHIVGSSIVDDQSFFGLTIRASFMVFKPDVGKLLYGKINKLGSHHYGCIIHNCINGSLRHPKRNNLTEEQKEKLDRLDIDDEILFKVFKLDVHHDILCVLGDIAPEFYGDDRNNFNSKKEESSVTDKDTNNNAHITFDDETSDHLLNGTHKHKKKKKKKEKQRSDSESTTDTTQEQSLKRKHNNRNVIGSTDSPVKKKKKKTKSLEPEEDTNTEFKEEIKSDIDSVSTITGSELSPSKKKKKSKKHKRVKEECD